MRTRCFSILAFAFSTTIPCAFAQTIDAFNPLPSAPPKALAIQPDGKILIGSSFQNVAGVVRQGVARLNADGSVDMSFGNPGAANGEVVAIAVQNDGKLLVGGDFDRIGGVARHSLARLNEDGTLDASFADPNLDSEVWSIAVQPDGKVLVAGDFTNAAGSPPRDYLARFNGDGSFDSSFADPQLCCLPARSVALQADGRVLVGGYFSQADGASHDSLARYSSSGVLDAAFPATPANSAVTALLVGPDGSIYANGGYSTSDGLNLRLVAKLSSAGALVSTFDNLHHDGSPNTFVLQPNGKLLIGGNFEQVDGQPRHALARLNADGTLDTTFADLSFSLDATDPNGSIFGLAVQADGDVLAVGNFSLADGQSRQYMARAVTADLATSRFTAQPSGSSVVVTWTRSGGGPELAQPPTLMHSTDGVNFSAVGPMTHIATGWQVTAPYNVHGALFYLQAIGTTSGGAQNGSTGQVASDVYFSDTIFADGFE